LKREKTIGEETHGFGGKQGKTRKPGLIQDNQPGLGEEKRRPRSRGGGPKELCVVAKKKPKELKIRVKTEFGSVETSGKGKPKK